MYSAKIIADSINSETRNRITTFELTYPRFVHAELMTHRLFSRNSASSRAIPNTKLRNRIKDDPVIPVWFGKNQKGMQAAEEINAEKISQAKDLILIARNTMLDVSEKLANLGMHKQIANRYIEPWMFITVLVTSTEYDNFFHLRTPQTPIGENPFLDEHHFDPNFPAQPEIQKIARLAWLKYINHEPQELAPDEWHLPLIDEEELDTYDDIDLVQISTGRCARVSYLTHDGIRDITADIDLHNKLVTSGHWSPFEHPAVALTTNKRSGNFYGWKGYRKTFNNEHYGKKLI